LRYLAESSEVQFWQGKLQKSASELRKYIEELRNHVTDTSKVETFYLYFHWRDLDEKAYYNLRIALTGLFCYEGEFLRTDSVCLYLANLLGEELSKYRFRVAQSKFVQFFDTLGSIPYAKEYKLGITLQMPIREFLGNYEESVNKLLRRIFTVRLNTPRRVKRKVFHRGYDDKGSESSVSERARRNANTVEFPYLTSDFLEFLRNHKDPIGHLRDLGFLLRE